MNRSTMNSEVERRLIGAYEAAKVAVAHGADLSMVQVSTVNTLRRSVRQPVRWFSPIVAGAAVAMVGGTVATAVVVTNWKADLPAMPKPAVTQPVPLGTPTAVRKGDPNPPVPPMSAAPTGEPWKQKTPPTLVMGQRFPYAVYTHCGFNQIELGGQRWTPVDPVPSVPQPRSGPDGVVTVNGYTSGFMTLADSGTLRFAVDDATVETAGVVVTYRIAAADALPQVCA